jgi:hypothetical protein
MLKYIFLSILFTSAFLRASSQTSGWKYLTFKLGINHNFVHPQPANPIDNYILDTDNQLHQLYTDNNILYDYSASFGLDLLYHHDFFNNKIGIVAGIGFQMKKYIFNYSTDNLDFTLKDKYKTYEIGIPLLFKYGNDVTGKLRFIYAGPRLNYILSAYNKNNYQNNLKFKLDRQELKPFKVSILAGFNYCSYNFEIEYQINSIFNKSFQNSSGNMPYSSQKGNFIIFKTYLHINIPHISAQIYFPQSKLNRIIERIFICSCYKRNSWPNEY